MESGQRDILKNSDVLEYLLLNIIHIYNFSLLLTVIVYTGISLSDNSTLPGDYLKILLGLSSASAVLVLLNVGLHYQKSKARARSRNINRIKTYRLEFWMKWIANILNLITMIVIVIMCIKYIPGGKIITDEWLAAIISLSVISLLATIYSWYLVITGTYERKKKVSDLKFEMLSRRS